MGGIEIVFLFAGYAGTSQTSDGGSSAVLFSQNTEIGGDETEDEDATRDVHSEMPDRQMSLQEGSTIMESDVESEDLCGVLPNSDLSQLMNSVQDTAVQNLVLQADDDGENISPNTGQNLVLTLQDPANLSQIEGTKYVQHCLETNFLLNKIHFQKQVSHIITFFQETVVMLLKV